jgi:hypothetical protein
MLLIIFISVSMDCKTELNGLIEYTWSKQGGLINPMFVNGQTLTMSGIVLHKIKPLMTQVCDSL